jgi:hypothetical protein
MEQITENFYSYRKYHKYKNYFNYYDVVRKIDEILSVGFSQTNWIKLESIIKDDIVYENYFFNKVADIVWFDSLKKRNYFDPLKAPGPKSADEKGFVTMPVWNVLLYLEKVSKQVIEPKNAKYIDELLKIIREVTSHHKVMKTLDNHNTWTYFMKILLNIPNGQIPLDIIALIPIWLESHFAGSTLSDTLALELLPKFLPEVPLIDDIKKAEKIFEYIIKVKWKEISKESFDSLYGIKEDPFLAVDHHWLTESLINKKYIYKIGERCSDDVIFTVADKLKIILRTQMNPCRFDVNIENIPYRIVVTHTKDFEFDCFGGVIDEEKRKKMDVDEKFFRKMRYIPEKEFTFTIAICRSGNNFARQIISNLKTINRGRIENGLYNRMLHFYKNMFDDFSYIWYKDLTVKPHWVDASSAKELLILFLKELVVTKIKVGKKIGVQMLNKLFSQSYQYPVFRRCGLFIISEFWSDYHNKFEKLLNRHNVVEWLNNINYETEIYELLEKNISYLSSTIKKRLKEIIENGPQHNLPDEKKERVVNYWKQKWYSALRADKEFDVLYAHYRKKTGTDEHISFKEPGEQIRSGPGPSPLSVEQVLTMQNNEIANFISTFQTKDWWEGPTEDALSETLTQAVKAQPNKFTSDLKPFLYTSYKYIVDILWGLRDAWNNKKEYDWGELLEFTKDYINRGEFWQDKLPIAGDHWKPDHKQVIGMIGDLIQDGTKDDAWVFDAKYNQIAQEIIRLILTDNYIDQLKSEKKSGYITDIHNTTLGNVIIALIYLSLRIARINEKKQDGKIENEKKWVDALKVLYEKALEKEVIEAYTVLGQYLPNIIYLDKPWAEKKITALEKPLKDEFWEAFITGYLNNMSVYDDIYRLQSMQQHYYKTIEQTSTDNEFIIERLANHGAIGYLRGNETLFDKILDKWQVPYLLNIINFFSRESRYILKPDVENREDLIKKVIAFWEKVYIKYEGKDSDIKDEDKRILSNVIKLTVYLSKIEKREFDWLMLSAKYVHIDSNERWLLEYLDALKDKGDIHYILPIILMMFENFTFAYAPDYVESIIVYAYEHGDMEAKQMANDICNGLGAAGFEYLRPVYEKYNDQKT